MIDINKIINALDKKILVLDGPMGTMIQKVKLSEDDFREKGLRILKNY